MGVNEIMAVAGGAAAVLGVVGGTFRYLVRIVASAERTSAEVSSMGREFTKHVDSSNELHRALTDRVSLHGEQLAALNARMGRRS